MNQVELVLERFNLDPLGERAEFDPAVYFPEEADVFTEALTEAKTGTASNALQRIADFIVKIGRAIVRGIQHIIAFITGLTKKGGLKTSVDEICAKVKLKRKEMKAQSAQKFVQKIYKDQRSTMDVPETIEVAVHNVAASIGDNGEVKVRFIETASPIKPTVKGNVTPAPNAFFALPLIEDEDLQRQMLDIVKGFVNAKDTAEYLRVNQDWQHFTTLFNDACQKMQPDGAGMYNMIPDLGKVYSFTTTVQALQKTSTFIAEISDCLAEAYSEEKSQELYQNARLLVTILNQIANIVSNMQMSVNAMSGAMRDIYKIDASYLESVDTIDQLDNFVREMITSGVPTKYVAFNVYLATSPTLKGDGSKGDAAHPVFGQSRMALFPDDKPDAMYKVAINGMGITGNKTEISVEQQFAKNGGSEYLPEMKAFSSDGLVITYERLKTMDISVANQLKYTQRVLEFKSKIDQFCNDHNIHMTITQDMHVGNIGFRGDQMVYLDFGMPALGDPVVFSPSALGF